MFDASVAGLIIVLLIGMVLLGVHVAVALGITSAVGIWLVTGRMSVVESLVATTATDALRDFTFAVIPLFMLMGEFIGRSGAITDIYVAINRALRRIPARLAVATVLGNAVFSFVTGVSIASAATFSRISYPEMKAHGYDKGFALGAIAGSSCLGMLIPPSVLMIVWGILTEQSIGRLFLAGVLPGLMLVTMMIAYIVFVGLTDRERVGEGKAHAEAALDPGAFDASRFVMTRAQLLSSIFGVFGIVAAVLGGIWFGLFTPTEGAGAGAVLALILAVVKGMRRDSFIKAIYSVGKTAAPIMILLLAAALYSRTLAMTGVTSSIRDLFLNSGLGPWGFLAIIVIIWFILGMLIDSISIMLLTVPIVEPVAMAYGFDQVSFAIVGIITIEAGLLTPPFGLLVYTVKAAITDSSVGVQDIFKSSIPYWLIMLIAATLLILFPEIATVLPDAVM